MQKYCRIAIAISLSISSFCALSSVPKSLTSADEVPVLSPQSQHKTASKRISSIFSRSHYKQFKFDDQLSGLVYDRYIKQLDYSRNVFLAADIKHLEQYRDKFDDMVESGKLDVAFEIYNLNVLRRLERYNYALSLLDKEFDFTLKESYEFDREEAQWPADTAELNELWRKKVKYDALNLKLAGKEWGDIKSVLTKRYNYAVKRLKQNESEDVFQIVMNAFSRTVEPHTSYLSPRNAERFQMEMNLSLEGIGAVLRIEEDYTVIQSVVTGGPADKSEQLKPKDRIIGVAQGDANFEDVVGWRLDDVVELIKGPKGSQVRLQVQSEDSEVSDIRVVSIVRDKIKLEDRAAKSEVFYEKVDDKNSRKIGIIDIPSFYNNLSKDVKTEIAKLRDLNVEGIIIDLRGNGGGSLTEATLLTGLFIDKGPVVQVRDGANRISINADTDGYSYYNGPLTVMVDRYSASASEIFAAAMQDYGRAIIVGEQTFGKGTVQQHRGLGRIYDLYENPLGSIQYTIAKFYRINGGSTQHKGVTPDILFPTAIDHAEWGESREENALPWDQIPKAKYNRLGNNASKVDYLTSLHKQRIKTNAEFNYLFDDIERYKAEKDDKSISLNLVERKAKREADKVRRLTRANERLVAMGKEKVESLDDLPEELNDIDPFLDETSRILFDFVSADKMVKK